MLRSVWKYGDYMGGLLCNGSPPFIKSLEKYKWNVRGVRGTIGGEVLNLLK